MGVSGLNKGTITNATNASPIVVTHNNHGLATGDVVIITGVEGNVSANGRWVVTVADSNSFSLDGSSGGGDYTTGGVVSEVLLATGVTSTSSAEVIKNDVQEQSTFTGTADIALSNTATSSSFSSFGVYDDGERLYYSIAEVDGSGVPNGNIETGIGIYRSETNTLEREQVLVKSGGSDSSPIDFGAGTKEVSGARFDSSDNEFLTSTGAEVPTAIIIGGLVFPQAELAAAEAEIMAYLRAGPTRVIPSTLNTGSQGLLVRTAGVAVRVAGFTGVSVTLLMMRGDTVPREMPLNIYDQRLMQGYLSVTARSSQTNLQRDREGSNNFVVLTPIDGNYQAMISLKTWVSRPVSRNGGYWSWCNFPILDYRNSTLVGRFYVDMNNLPSLPFRVVAARLPTQRAVSGVPVDIFIDGVQSVENFWGVEEPRPRIFAMPWYSPVARTNGLDGADRVGHELTTHDGVVCLSPRLASANGWMNETDVMYSETPSRYLYLGTVVPQVASGDEPPTTGLIVHNRPNKRCVWNHYNRVAYRDTKRGREGFYRQPTIATYQDGSGTELWGSLLDSSTAGRLRHQFILPDTSSAENQSASPKIEISVTSTPGPLKLRVAHEYRSSATASASTEYARINRNVDQGYGSLSIGDGNYHRLDGDGAARIDAPGGKGIFIGNNPRSGLYRRFWDWFIHNAGFPGGPGSGEKVGFGSFIVQVGLTSAVRSDGTPTRTLQAFYEEQTGLMLAPDNNASPTFCRWGFYGDAFQAELRAGHDLTASASRESDRSALTRCFFSAEGEC